MKAWAVGTVALMASLGCGRIEFTESRARASTGIDAAADDAEPGGEGNSPDGSDRCARDEFVVRVDSDADDGEVDVQNGTVVGFLPRGENGPPDGLYMGHWNDGPTYGYYRFALPVAVTSTTFRGAHLRFWGLGSDGWNDAVHSLRVVMANTADASPIDSGDDRPFGPTGEPVTSEEVRWPAAGGLAWTSNAVNTSPDLGPLFRELLDEQGTVASGAHVVFWFDGDFGGSNSEVVAADSSNAIDRPAELRLEVCR